MTQRMYVVVCETTSTDETKQRELLNINGARIMDRARAMEEATEMRKHYADTTYTVCRLVPERNTQP